MKIIYYLVILFSLFFFSCSVDNFEQDDEISKFDELNDIVYSKQIDIEAFESWVQENKEIVKSPNFEENLNISSHRNKAKNLITFNIYKMNQLETRGTPCFDEFTSDMNWIIAITAICYVGSSGWGAIGCTAGFIYATNEAIEDLEACVNG